MQFMLMRKSLKGLNMNTPDEIRGMDDGTTLTG